MKISEPFTKRGFVQIQYFILDTFIYPIGVKYADIVLLKIKTISDRLRRHKTF